jgi:hypothetical protein
MPSNVRRVAVLTAIALSAALSACTNPVAPAARQQDEAPDRPNTETAMQGSVG